MCVIDTTDPTTTSAAAPDVSAPPQGPLAVDLQGITKRFPGVVANSDLYLQVERGTIHAIVGENGAGKSTLMKILYGVQKPDEGTIRTNCRVSFPLGFMGGVIAKLSANENSRYIARIYGLDPDYVSAFCRWLCDIGEYFDRPVGTYSAGMRARLTFALLLALEFDIYLIDEGIPQTTDVEFNRKAGRVLF